MKHDNDDSGGRLRRSLYGGIALLLVLGAATAPALARDEARISGKVVDVDGNPVDNVTVALVPSGEGVGSRVETKTNKKGRYVQPACPNGTYMPQIVETEWFITRVHFVARAPDGTKAGEFEEEVSAEAGVPTFQTMSNMRGTLNLTIDKGEQARPSEEEITGAQDESALLIPLNELFEWGDWDGLLKKSDETLAKHPDVGSVHYLKAVALWKTGDLAAAAESMKVAAEMVPDQPGIEGTLGSLLIEHGNALREAGQEEDAVAAYDLAATRIAVQIERTPGETSYLINRYIALNNAGKRDQAIEALEALIAADPQNPKPYLTLAEQLTNSGRPEEAVAAIDRLPEGGEDAAAVIYNAAVELWNAGNMDATIAAMDKAISMAPEMPLLYRLKGRAYLSKGEDADGIAMLKQYLSMVPEDDPAAETDRALVQALGGGD